MCFIAWILYMADTNQATVFFDWVRRTPHGDKIGHIVLFGFLAFCLNLASTFRTINRGCFSIYQGSLVVLLFVTLEELSQAFIPQRTLDGMDYLASVMGIVLFSILTFFVKKITFKTLS